MASRIVKVVLAGLLLCQIASEKPNITTQVLLLRLGSSCQSRKQAYCSRCIVLAFLKVFNFACVACPDVCLFFLVWIFASKFQDLDAESIMGIADTASPCC